LRDEVAEFLNAAAFNHAFGFNTEHILTRVKAAYYGQFSDSDTPMEVKTFQDAYDAAVGQLLSMRANSSILV
jgi:hypothetical protein